MILEIEIRVSGNTKQLDIDWKTSLKVKELVEINPEWSEWLKRN